MSQSLDAFLTQLKQRDPNQPNSTKLWKRWSAACGPSWKASRAT